MQMWPKLSYVDRAYIEGGLGIENLTPLHAEAPVLAWLYLIANSYACGESRARAILRRLELL